MAAKKPAAVKPKKRGAKPKPRFRVVLTAAPPGEDEIAWALRLLENVLLQEPISGCVRLTIRAGESFDVVLIAKNIADLFRHAGLIEETARITDIDARTDRTIDREAVEVEARGTYAPAHRLSKEAREAAARKRDRLWSIYRRASAEYQREFGRCQF